MVVVETTRVLAAGSLDVDNFGDLLFLYVTEPYLVPAEVVAAAPFGWPLDVLPDRKVAPYGRLLRDEKFDVVWVLGGELGCGIQTAQHAFEISAPPAVRSSYGALGQSSRVAMIDDLVFGAPIVSPYIPPVRAFGRSKDAVSVLSSVGISHMLSSVSAAGLPANRDELVALLVGYDLISVRDKESSDLLKVLGIDHGLGPDIVHTISLHRPRQKDTRSNVAVFQMNDVVIHRLGLANVAAAIAGSVGLSEYSVRLICAGTFRHSDSPETCEDLVAAVRRIAPRLDIEFVDVRRPLEIADHISQAKIVIGTSLHLRIVASSYGVPRVTLYGGHPKTVRYSRYWDAQMPFDVLLPGLDDAIADALRTGTRADAATRSEELARLADENARQLVRRAVELRSRRRVPTGISVR